MTKSVNRSTPGKEIRRYVTKDYDMKSLTSTFPDSWRCWNSLEWPVSRLGCCEKRTASWLRFFLAADPMEASDFSRPLVSSLLLVLREGRWVAVLSIGQYNDRISQLWKLQHTWWSWSWGAPSSRSGGRINEVVTQNGPYLFSKQLVLQ